MNLDSTFSDQLNRKWRKIVAGVQMTREGYEELGEVKLDSCDFATSLDSTYTCSKKLKGKLNPIIVDYRNQQLVNRIIQSKSDKIAVVYGEIHIKGLKELLKEKSGPA
ncbi:MAG: hypothetical protein L3J66_02020 [Bacteroidales bacterium]|nr:hypothetical protein [Bacteroidales bacterium]